MTLKALSSFYKRFLLCGWMLFMILIQSKAQTFTASWPFTSNLNATVTGNTSALSALTATVNTQLFTTSKAYASGGITGTGTNGSSSTPSCISTYDKAGTITPYMEMKLSPAGNNTLSISPFSFTVTAGSLSSSNMVIAAGYSVDGGTVYSGFSISVNGATATVPGTTGTSLSTGTVLTISTTSTLTIPVSKSLIIHLIYWKNATGTTSANPITISGISMNGNAVAGLSSQTINFTALTPVTYGSASFNLNAIASSGLTVSYASSNTAVATITGNTVTVIGAGSTTITASQAGNSSYSSATDVTQTLTVNKKALTISGLTISDKNYDGTNTATINGNPALTGVLSTDSGSVNISGTPVAVFSDANAGAGKAVTVSGYLISGSGSTNYSVSQPTGLTASITAIPPVLTTTTISAITGSSAQSGGTVTSTGGTAVTSEGVCWSVNANPTIADSKTSDGTASPFTSAITGLNSATTYHVRAYATNAAGTSYGADYSFNTLVQLIPQNLLTTDYSTNGISSSWYTTATNCVFDTSKCSVILSPNYTAYVNEK